MTMALGGTDNRQHPAGQVALAGQVLVVLHNFAYGFQPAQGSEVSIGEGQFDFVHPAIDGGLYSVRHFFGNGHDQVMVESGGCHGLVSLSLEKLSPAARVYDPDKNE